MKRTVCLLYLLLYFIDAAKCQQSACGDTTKRVQIGGYVLFLPDEPITKTSDNSFIIPTATSANFSPGNLPVAITKCSAGGRIIWTRTFTVSVTGLADVGSSSFRVKELSNGDLLFSSTSSYLYTTRSEFMILRINPAGNIVWAKSYKSNLWTDSRQGNARIASLEEDQAGNIFIGGEHSPTNTGTAAFIMKLSASGQKLWDKTYKSAYPFMLSYGLAIINNNELVFFGQHEKTTYASAFIWAMKINTATGDTITTKGFTPNYGNNAVRRSFTDLPTITKLNNGNIAIQGTALSDLQNFPQQDTFYHNNVAIFSPQLSYVSGISVCSKKISDYRNTVVTIHPDEKIVYSRTQSGLVNGTYETFYGSVINSSIVKERVYRTTTPGAYTSNFLQMDGNKDLVLHQTRQLAIMNDKDSSVSCNGSDTSVSFIQPLQFTTIAPNFTTSISNSFIETGRTFVAGTFNLATSATMCEKVTKCEKIALSTSTGFFCSSTPVTIRAGRNPGCNSKVIWRYPYAIATVVSSNDTTLTLQFHNSWKGKIFASITGCADLTDSLQISVSSSPGPVNLGNDTVMCVGSPLTLRANSAYFHFLWQDGSTDSTLIINAPGIYSILVTDSCSNTYRDTVSVKNASIAAFELGGDKLKCNNDSIFLNAPSGFREYQWSPSSYLTSTNSQTTIAFPVVSTVYSVSAKTPTGCQVSGSIKVFVEVSPAINLGNDTSFCSYDSITLSAGSSFSEYKWSTGNSSPAITVKSPGKYSVVAKATNGCYSRDTLVVQQVFPSPAVNLGTDFDLCTGEQRRLDAGASSLYLWQDGSRNRYYTANNVGTYFVKTTDNNNCLATDTINVKNILPLPANFLKPIDSICSYTKLQLQPPGNYVTYNWSIGSSQQNITVDKPGEYVLTVTDAAGCKGRDTIRIVQRNCMLGVYIPTAFSPNNNGVNDVFRAKVFGNVTSFRLQVFNRFGQVVFTTTDPAIAWDGKVGGIPNDAGTFVYQCTYQLQGLKPVVEKGTIILLR